MAKKKHSIRAPEAVRSPNASNTTTHTVRPLREGGAKPVVVSHEDYCAIEYEFYIPAAIWAHSATQTFIHRLQSVEPGATLFTGLHGIWRGQSEYTHVYRLILQACRFDRRNVRMTLQTEVGVLMAALSTWEESRQEEVWFTEREIHVSRSSV
jgi:hypothetical protein